MNWFYNMRIAIRLPFFVGGILIAFLMASAFSLYSIYDADRENSQMMVSNCKQVEIAMQLVDHYNDMTLQVGSAGYAAGRSDQAMALRDNFNNSYGEITKALKSFKSLDNTAVDSTFVSQIEKGIAAYQNYAESIFEAVETNHFETVEEAFENRDTNPEFIKLRENIKSFWNAIDSNMLTSNQAVTINVRKTIYVISAILLMVLVASLVLVVILSRSIRKPLTALVGAAKQVADGNTDIVLQSNYRDEIGVLANQMGKMVDAMRGIIGDINRVAQDQVNGDFDSLIDVEKYEGGYKEVAEGVNRMVTSNREDNAAIVNCVREYADGNFIAVAPQFPGKKAALNNILNHLKSNLEKISGDIQILAKEAAGGNLNKRIDLSKYNNDWYKIGTELNCLINAVSVPVKETSEVLEQISRGQLDVSLTGDYCGEFLEMKNVINNTIEQLNQYIGDISWTLRELAEDRYDISISMDYRGDFKPVKDGLNTIINRVNHVMKDVNVYAGQIASSARQISESSMSLSEGATEQASAIEELNASIENVAVQTRSNAQLAHTVNSHAVSAKENAKAGNQDMQNVLLAMEEIHTASRDISKIVKVIEEIAFQTNLLALNAAVEAAHAGHHGKGFTVVADQVRNLSARSSEAAKNTTVLIGSSLQKVGDGMKVAHETAGALEKIVLDITDISALVDNIAAASESQAQNIDQINIGISQISQVTQNNTASSEEEAALAEEMSGQAQKFQNMVSKFNLKEDPMSYADF